MGSRARMYLVAAVAVMGCAAPSAAADGLPVPVEQTFGDGVLSPDGHSRYVTMQAGGDTVVMAIATSGGEVTDYTIRNGTFTVPAVAVDGTPSGISADGETLALIKPRETFPRRSTEFLVYQAERLRRDFERFELEGDFSFDALSPDGRTMYLIEYTDPRDPGAYQVRSLDISTRELDPDPILDSQEEPGEMRGFPQTRLTSPDGRWEYTLYDGGEHPFIHALDVVDGITLCIDLDMIHARQTYGATLAMSADGSAIELKDRKGILRAVMDPETHAVTEPGEKTEPAAVPADPKDSGLEAAGIVAGGALMALLAAVGLLRARKSRDNPA